jgi:hypothetical protein
MDVFMDRISHLVGPSSHMIQHVRKCEWVRRFGIWVCCKKERRKPQVETKLAGSLKDKNYWLCSFLWVKRDNSP